MASRLPGGTPRERPEVSVVIPTYDRLDVLPEVLAALESQRDAPPFEVIVVDDGSTDGTDRFLESWLPPYQATVLAQDNAGPAAARNRGVAAARGRWVAFLGDDTVPEPGWMAAHRAAHRARGDGRELAVIGYTRWHPRMETTPFLEYINEYGLQFGYALIEDKEDVPFNFFYTSNLSLTREALLEEPFDLRFPYPAWEDIEASYRMKQKGLQLVYEPAARVLHDHPTDLARFAVRQEKAGYSAVVFYGLHPELGSFLGIGPDGPPPVPRGFKPWCQKVLARALHSMHSVQALMPKKAERLWDEALRIEYIHGLTRGWQDQAHRQ